MADFNTNDDLAWSDEFDTTNMQTVDYKQYFESKGYIVEEKTTDSGTGYIITSVGTNGKPDGGAIIIPPPEPSSAFTAARRTASSLKADGFP